MLKKKENTKIIKRVVVHRMMPPSLTGNDIESATITAISPEGNLVTYKSDLIQFGKAAGTSMGNNRHSGYDVRHNSNFVLCLDSQNKIVNIHIFPKNDYSSQAPPSSLVEQELVDCKIDQNTGDVTIVAMPLSVRQAVVLNIVSKIDELEEISPGQAITDTCVVDSVAGNQVKLRISTAPAQAVTTLSQVRQENAGR